MGNLYDIANSAINAQRESLKTTSQNIANINTDGYNRRETDLAEVAGSQGDMVSVGAQGGLGVRVEEVRRAFDELLVKRVRDSASRFHSTQTYVNNLERLEKVLLPEGDLAASINKFFDSLSALAASPGDNVARVTALSAGGSLTAAFHLTSEVLKELTRELQQGIEITVEKLNQLTSSLAQVNKEIMSSNQGANASPALLDTRDKLLQEISKIAAVDTSLKVRGDAEVSLGYDSTGITIVEAGNAQVISTNASQRALEAVTFFIDEEKPIGFFEGGSLRGLVDSYNVAQLAQNDLDLLTERFVDEINDAHQGGVDINGNAGKPMFSATKHDVSVLKAGDNRLELTFNAFPGFSDTLESAVVEFDETSGFWVVTDNNDAVLGSGRDSINITAGLISISGIPTAGDKFSITKQDGAASNLEFLLRSADEFAATSKISTEASPTNTGSASLEVRNAINPPAALATLSDNIANNLSPVAATEFLKNGFVGAIPVGMEKVHIASTSAQSKLLFEDPDLVELASFSLAINSEDYDFTIPTGAGALEIDSVADIAHYLKLGTLVGIQRSTGDNYNLKDLSVFVGSTHSSLSFVTAETPLEGGEFTVDGVSTNGVLSPVTEASDVQVFTREGRHIAGTPLSSTQILELVKEDNGFSESAIYSAKYLNKTGNGNGYRNIEVETFLANGANRVSFGLAPLSGISSSIMANDGPNPQNRSPSQTLTFTSDATGLSHELDLPGSVSARVAAEIINNNIGAKGVLASASNIIELTTVESSPTGKIGFNIVGANEGVFSVEAEYTAGIGFSRLAEEIQRYAAKTGISASVNADNTRMVLVQEEGADLSFSSLVGLSLDARVLDAGFNEVQAQRLSNEEGIATRFSGLVNIDYGESISVKSDLGTTLTSSSETYRNSQVSRVFSGAGDTAEYKFHVDPVLDKNSYYPNQDKNYAGAGTFSISVPFDYSLPVSYSVNAADLEDATPTVLAKHLVTQARSEAPVPKISGELIDALPSVGMEMQFQYAGEEYTLTSTEEGLTVDGPESSQLYVDVTEESDSYRLSLSIPDGAVAGSAIIPVNNGQQANFGFSGVWTNYLTGRLPPEDLGLGSSSAMNVLLDGVNEVAVSVSRAMDGSYSISSSSAGLNAEFEDGTTSSTTLQKISMYSSASLDKMEVIATQDAADLGFKISSHEITVLSDGTLKARAIDSGVSTFQIDGERSNNTNLIRIENLPPEELIVLVTGAGAKKISATSEVKEQSQTPEVTYEFKLTDSQNKVVEIFDSQTGHSIATRHLIDQKPLQYGDHEFLVSGQMELADTLLVSFNKDSGLNGKNMERMIALGKTEANRDSYQDDFRNIVISVGAKLSANRFELTSNKAQHDAAVEEKDVFSGVNLDNEAANLIKQQQAYQAAARLLQTARDMFDTLVRIG